VGIGGSRLTPAQRQKVSLARAVIKRPDILVIDDATASFDSRTETRLVENLSREFSERTLVWVSQRAALAESFDRLLVVQGGRVVEEGEFSTLSASGDHFPRLLTETA